MPLSKQKIQLAISGGIDTKTDDKNVLATNFLELENCVFTNTGSLTKRNGYNILSNQTVDGQVIDNGLGLATFKEELLQFDGRKMYSYLDSLDQWVDKGSVVSVIAETNPILNNSFAQTDAEYGILNNIEMYAWNDSRGGVRYSVLDRETQNFIISNVEVDAAAQDPKVLKFGIYLMLIYQVGSSLQYRLVNQATPGILSDPIQLASNVDTDSVYDVTVGSERLFIAWKNGAGTYRLKFITTSLVQSNEVFDNSVTIDSAITLTCDCNTNVQLAFATPTEVQYTTYNYDLDAVITPLTTVETIQDVQHITVKETDSDNEINTILYDVLPAGMDPFIRTAEISNSGIVTAPSEFMRSVGLYSKIFNNGIDDYVVTAFDSDIQASYFVFSLEGDLIATIVPQNGGGLKTGSNLTEVANPSEGVYQLAILQRHSIVSDNGTVFSLTGVQGTSLDFASTNHYLNAELGDNLHIVGGILQMYDGRSVVEHGFSYFPEGVTIATSAGGSLEAGSYQYSVVYAWTDNYGQLHRSAPSLPVTLLANAGEQAVLTIPTLRVTKKEDAFIEVYGTEANGTIFYRLTDTAAPIFNDTSVDTLSFTDTQSDFEKIDGELLYITGGELDNISPGSSSLITTYKSRIILGGLEDDNTIQYSKERSENEPVEFSDALTLSVDSRGGRMTALSNLDNYIIVFKERAIFAFSGEGPNNLGEQNDFRVPQLITTDAGCVDSNSVVETPLGLMFKSDKGIYRLNRGLQVDYLGAPVELFNDNEITSATLLSTTNQVRFTTADDLALVFDYYHNRWSTFTNHEAQDSDVYQNDFVFVKSNGDVFRETPGVFVDGSQWIKTKIVSSWLQLAGVQGFQRFYRMLLLGNFQSDHRLAVSFGYDFNPVFSQSTDIDAAAILDPQNYGDTSPYGSEETYGGEFPLYQWEVHPMIQKCQAFRFRLEDIQTDNFAEAFSISNMAMIIGVKTGLNKMSDSRGFGTTTGGKG